MKGPYFSIIVPFFNRETTIGRAVESCLSQSYSNFELILVDDGSTDRSLSIAGRHDDPRIVVHQHATNKGPCPARNTGVAHSNGEWCVMLDSDFSLLPGALEKLNERTRRAQPEVGNVASSCLWDRSWGGGNVTPLPGVPDEILDYIGYLRWSETLTVPEYFNCIRREVFSTIRYPDNRAWETSFHLNLAKHWKVHITRDIIVKIHTDAPNRLTSGSGKLAARRTLLEAGDKLEDLNFIWNHHGDALREHAPGIYLGLLRETGRVSFLCGLRRQGMRYMARYLRNAPFNMRACMIPMFGLIGPRAVAWAGTRR